VAAANAVQAHRGVCVAFARGGVAHARTTPMSLNAINSIVRDDRFPISAATERRNELSHFSGRHRRCAPDEVLYREGEEVRVVYYVRDGLIKLFTHFESGRRRIVRLQRRGDWLGLSGFFERPHLHTAVSIGQHTRVDCYPIRRLVELQRRSPSVQATVLQQCYADLVKADRWIADFSTGGIRGRVARLIGYLAAPNTTTGCAEVDLLTVQEMGEILGVTPESVSRIVAGYKRDGVLRRPAGEPSKPFLIDQDRLQGE